MSRKDNREFPESEQYIAAKKVRCRNGLDRDAFYEAVASEVEMLAELSHPNIGNLVGFEEDLKNNLVWIFTSWETNGNLSEFLASGQLEISERFSLIQDVMAGLKYLHTLQPPICHGNLKSRNVLVNSSSRAVITDFLSTRAFGNGNNQQNQASVLQPLGIQSTTSPRLHISYCGTKFCLTAMVDHLQWEAPEVLSGMQPGLPSDIWAAGWICCEVIIKKPPFPEMECWSLDSPETFTWKLPDVGGASVANNLHSLCRLAETCFVLDPMKRPSIAACEAQVNEMLSIIPAPRSKIRSLVLLLELGRMHHQLGNKTTSASLFTDAMAIARYIEDHGFVADALLGLGHARRELGDFSAAEVSLLEAKEIYTKIGHLLGQARASCGLGEVYRFQTRYIEAENLLTSALNIFTRFDDEPDLGTTLRGLGAIYRVQLKYQQAEESLIQARHAFTHIGNDLGQADALGGLGDVYRVQAKYNEAMECFMDARDVYTRIGNNMGRADMFHGLGNVYRAEARFLKAEGCFKQARDIYSLLGHDRGVAGALRGLGNVSRALSKYEEAEKYFAECRDICECLGDDTGRAGALRGLGNVYRVQERFREAADSYILAQDIYVTIGNELGQAHAMGGLGDVHRGQGNYHEAELFLNKAYEIYTRIGSERSRADTMASLGSVYDVQAMYDKATTFFIQARDIYRRIGYEVGQADMLGVLGEMYLFQDMYQEAEESFSRAQCIYRRTGDDRGRARALKGLDKVSQAFKSQPETLENRGIGDARTLVGPREEMVADEAGSPQSSTGVVDGPSATSSVSFDLDSLMVWVSPTPINVNGHFCDVFEGTHELAGKVALKRPRIGGTGYDDAVIRRFEREASTWQRLQHPHILEFIGTLNRDNHLYLVSPFINNGTLVEYLVQSPRVDRIKLLRETAGAIQYLHTEKIVHGDIKGTNILISDEAHALLCDFGLTKMIDSRTSTCVKGAGSVRWMGPELWDNEPRTFESDVYAFGMTISEVITGKPPFPHLSTSMAVMMAVIGRNERPPHDPLLSSEGRSYKETWEIAAACWPTKPSERITMAEASRRLCKEY